MKTAFHFQFNNHFYKNKNFVQLLCALFTLLFFFSVTRSVFAYENPFRLTPEKMGIFQGLPDKFRGFFSSDNMILNGFFNYVQQNMGGASGLQGTPLPPSYPPGTIPIPTTGDFIKITSSWTANCIRDIPPDELYPEVMENPGNEVCPWSPTGGTAVCPGAPGVGCVQASLGRRVCVINSQLYVYDDMVPDGSGGTTRCGGHWWLRSPDCCGGAKAVYGGPMCPELCGPLTCVTVEFENWGSCPRETVSVCGAAAAAP